MRQLCSTRLLILAAIAMTVAARDASAQAPKPAIKLTTPAPSGNIAPVTQPDVTRPVSTGVTTTANLPDGIYKVGIVVYNYDQETVEVTEGTVRIRSGSGTVLIDAKFPFGYDCQSGAIQITVTAPDGVTMSTISGRFTYGNCG